MDSNLLALDALLPNLNDYTGDGVGRKGHPCPGQQLWARLPGVAVLASVLSRVWPGASCGTQWASVSPNEWSHPPEMC